MARWPPPSNEVDVEAARRIAIRAQALDGSARDVLETVQRLGFLQLDPIATVATPQELVLWSRLGSFDRSELDRLLWDERALFEWNAFVWPIESLPMVRGLMRRWRTSTHYAHERWGHGSSPRTSLSGAMCCASSSSAARSLAGARRQRSRRAAGSPLVRRRGGWHYADGAPSAGRGRRRRAVVASSGSGILPSVVPAGEAMTLARREPPLDEQRFRALGVRLEKGRLIAHPDADDSPVPDRVTSALPVRPPDSRPRPSRAAVRLPLPARDVRHAREARVRLLRAATPRRRADRRPRRAGLDRKTNTMRLLGAWGDTSRLDEAMTSLASFLGAPHRLAEAYETTSKSFVKCVMISQPSAVTATRSSIRQPPTPGR